MPDQNKLFSERVGEFAGGTGSSIPRFLYDYFTPGGLGAKAGEGIKRGTEALAGLAGEAVGRIEATPFGRGFANQQPSLPPAIQSLISPGQQGPVVPQADQTALPPIGGEPAPTARAINPEENFRKLFGVNAIIDRAPIHPQWKKAMRSQFASRFLDMGMDPYEVMVWVEGGSQGFLPLMQMRGRPAKADDTDKKFRQDLVKSFATSLIRGGPDVQEETFPGSTEKTGLFGLGGRRTKAADLIEKLMALSTGEDDRLARAAASVQ